MEEATILRGELINEILRAGYCSAEIGSEPTCLTLEAFGSRVRIDVYLTVSLNKVTNSLDMLDLL